MSRAVTLTDPKAAACFARGRGTHFLAAYFEGPASVSQAAEYVHAPLAKVHYWTIKWLELGVLEVVDEIPRAGRAVKRYRTVADRFVIPAALLPEELLTEQIDRSAKELSRALIRALPEVAYGGNVTVHKPDGQRWVTTDRTEHVGEVPRRGDALQCTFEAALTDEEAREAQQELLAFQRKWLQRSAQTDPPTHLFFVGMAPTIPE